MVPTAIGLAVDERTLREANVWLKPLKFQLSLAVLALTLTALAAALPAAVRAARSWSALVWTALLTGGFEIVYITGQAALGEASHYNVSTPGSAALYSAMGIAAVALTATQPWLAVLLWRHAPRSEPPAWRLAVQFGLWSAFVLGAGVGVLLGGTQPAGGPGLAVLGWSHAGPDLRPAHCVGLHAAQALPLAAFALLRAGVLGPAAVVAVGAFGVVWSAACVVLAGQALSGHPFGLR